MSASHNILVMLNTAMRPYFRHIANGVANYANQHQHPAWHLSLPNYFGPFLRPYPTDPSDRFDGVITGITRPEFIERWVNAGKAASFIGFNQPCPADLTYTELDETAALACRHLRSGGAEHLAYFGLDDPKDPWSQDMIRAFQAAARQGTVFRRQTGGAWSYEAESIELSAWLRALPARTGILSGNDDYAGRIYEAASRVSLQPGRNFTVIGFGNDPIYCESLRPPLSSVDLPLGRMGYCAAERLAERLEDASLPPRWTKIGPPTLVRRSSHYFREIDDDLVDRALALLRSDLSGIRSAADLARKIGTSRHTLQRRLTAVLGESPARTIRGVRLQEARRLLTTTAMPVAEVAAHAGFADQAHLTRVMKAELGKTPRQLVRESAELA